MPADVYEVAAKAVYEAQGRGRWGDLADATREWFVVEYRPAVDAVLDELANRVDAYVGPSFTSQHDVAAFIRNLVRPVRGGESE